MKKILIILLLLSTIPIAAADSITGVTISQSVRLYEKVTVSGQYIEKDLNAFTLCKFVVFDGNGIAIDRWSDEYTFSDGSFHAEKTIQEPPYYRGDDFNVTITCGTAQASELFSVIQPTSLAHPVQMGWEYMFEESNLEAIMFFATFVALGVICIGLVVLAIKRGKTYAG